MGMFAEFFSTGLLFCLVFGMSATVDIGEVRKQLKNRAALLTGVSMQFIILPFLGFVVVKLFGLSAPVGITLLVITSSPGGSYSNWWCSIFNAELALSVTMTAISTFMSVFMLPLNLIIYTSSTYSSEVVDNIDWPALFTELSVVIGGIVSGIYCSALFKHDAEKTHKFHILANKMGNISGLSLVAFSVLVSSNSSSSSDNDKTSSSNSAPTVWEQEPTFFIGVAIPAVFGIVIATYIATRCNLEKPERVAVAVESCYQNTGIATSVAISMFRGDELAAAVGVPLYYGIVEMALLAVYCVICWKLGWTKAPADENFCVMVTSSYEVKPYDEIEFQENVEVVLAGDMMMNNTSFNYDFDYGGNAATSPRHGGIGGGGSGGVGGNNDVENMNDYSRRPTHSKDLPGIMDELSEQTTSSEIIFIERTSSNSMSGAGGVHGGGMSYIIDQPSLDNMTVLEQMKEPQQIFDNANGIKRGKMTSIDDNTKNGPIKAMKQTAAGGKRIVRRAVASVKARGRGYKTAPRPFDDYRNHHIPEPSTLGLGTDTAEVPLQDSEKHTSASTSSVSSSSPISTDNNVGAFISSYNITEENVPTPSEKVII